MPTFTALATTADAVSAAALGDAIEALSPSGVGVFEIEDGSGRWEVGGYFLERPDDTALALLAAAWGASPFVVSEVPDTDWVAQVRRELTPVVAGRFVVHGAHDRPRIPVNAISLEIEAAMAFGTGHHPTTEGCLALFDRLLRAGWRARTALDIGCGTAVLAMAAARVGARVLASDLDPTAATAAAHNVAWNGLRHRVAVAFGPGFRPHRRRGRAPVDLVFANILARPLRALAPDAARACAPGGVIILSGLLDAQAPMVEARYRAWGFAPLDRLALRGWTTLAMRRRRGRSSARRA